MAIRRKRAISITPSDTDDLAFPITALYAEVGGDVRVMTVGGDDVIIPGIGTGVQLAGLMITRVFATDTTATGLVGLR